jgi:hypothetical protein
MGLVCLADAAGWKTACGRQVTSSLESFIIPISVVDNNGGISENFCDTRRAISLGKSNVGTGSAFTQMHESN